MRKSLCFIAFAVLISFSGCRHHAPINGRTDAAKEKVAIQRRLEDIFDAAARKDLPRLESYHLYGPKFSKFAPESPARLDAEAARQGERNAFTRIDDFSAKAGDLKIDLFGPTAIATFVLNYSFKLETNNINRQALATLVFVKDRGEWKITHEHISPPKP